MRPKLLLLFVLLYVIKDKTYCQEAENTKVYEIRNSVAVYPCDITGKRVFSSDSVVHTPPLGAKFMLVRPLSAKNDTLIIRYLLWNEKKDPVLYKYYNEPWNKDDTSSSQSIKNGSAKTWDRINWEGVRHSDSGIDSGRNSYEYKVDKFFRIQKYDLDSNCVKVYNSGIKSTTFTIGLVTMPLKLRLGANFDFQGNLSLGSTAGVKTRLSKYSSSYINLLLGTSISTISLDSFSTRGKLIGQPLTNIAVFSPSLGVVFEFGKAQAGIFYGWDILNKSTQSKYEWIYNKKPWLSLGFGFSILNVDSKSNSSQSQKQ